MTDNIDDFLTELCGPIDYRFDSVVHNDRSMVAMKRSQSCDAVCISRIKTEPEYCGQMLASALLKTVCGAADKAGVTLFLEVEREDACEMTEQKLVEWYMRRGFRGDSSGMIREPMATGQGVSDP